LSFVLLRNYLKIKEKEKEKGKKNKNQNVRNPRENSSKQDEKIN
jgi:hypothetical protein